jgi:hypothetical protein
MQPKAVVLRLLLIPLAIYAVLLGVYFARPTLFHFRAWELFDVLVMNGLHARSVDMVETGDSSRDYLFQRYLQRNRVSVDTLGNRVACYDDRPGARPRVLLLGDSQLFGSGTDDAGTFGAQMCRRTGAAIYNGGRQSGLDLLRVASMPFDAILFTVTEHSAFATRYCRKLDDLAAQYDRKLGRDDLAITPVGPLQLTRALGGAVASVQGYLGSRIRRLMAWTHEASTAPDGHIIKYPHRHQPAARFIDSDLSCAQRLAAFFEPRGYQVGFLYFPAHQTIYGPESGMTIDADTLSYISLATERFRAAGLRTMDTRDCLMRAKAQALVVQMHDTHLSAAGYGALADCLGQSELAGLFRSDGGDAAGTLPPAGAATPGAALPGR